MQCSPWECPHLNFNLSPNLFRKQKIGFVDEFTPDCLLNSSLVWIGFNLRPDVPFKLLVQNLQKYWHKRQKTQLPAQIYTLFTFSAQLRKILANLSPFWFHRRTIKRRSLQVRLLSWLFFKFFFALQSKTYHAACHISMRKVVMLSASNFVA